MNKVLMSDYASERARRQLVIDAVEVGRGLGEQMPDCDDRARRAIVCILRNNSVAYRWWVGASWLARDRVVSDVVFRVEKIENEENS
jgi:hypothetical protein